MDLQRIALISLALTFSSPLLAAQYQITVDSQFVTDISVPPVFGLSGPSVPTTFSFVVDTSTTPTISLPIGAQFGISGGFLTTPAELISVGSITGLNVSLGTGSWTTTDLATQQTETGLPFAVILFGSLVDGATAQIHLFLTNATGLYATNPWSYSTGNPLEVGDGVAVDNLGKLGRIIGTHATVVALNQTPAEQIADVIASLDTLVDLPAGVKNSLSASLGGALDKLDPIAGLNISAAKGKLDAFVSKVQAQRGKKLTTQQADNLIAVAVAIKAQL